MAESDRFSLQELTDAAGVSVRTVRYYIAEGLLPPPMGSGPASFYTPNHLRRLRLIGRLKEAYLPLKEIRRRLEATPDAAVEGLLGLEDAALFDPATWERSGAGPEAAGTGTLRYIDRVLARQGPWPLRESEPIPFRSASPAPTPAAGGAEADDPVVEIGPAGGAAGDGRRSAGRSATRSASRAPRKGTGVAPMPVAQAQAVASRGTAVVDEPEPDAWRRIPLGPGAELLVSEAVYRRLRDRVDWLVRQARRVFA